MNMVLSPVRVPRLLIATDHTQAFCHVITMSGFLYYRTGFHQHLEAHPPDPPARDPPAGSKKTVGLIRPNTAKLLMNGPGAVARMEESVAGF
jgi:hypothetical protein